MSTYASILAGSPKQELFESLCHNWPEKLRPRDKVHPLHFPVIGRRAEGLGIRGRRDGEVAWPEAELAGCAREQG